MALLGVIDAAYSPRLHGWVQGPEDKELRVRVLRKDAQPIEVVADQSRHDLSQHAGRRAFAVSVPGGFALGELVDGRLTALVDDGVSTAALTLWAPLAAAARAEALSEPQRARMQAFLDHGHAEAAAAPGDSDNAVRTSRGLLFGDISEDAVCIRGRSGTLFLHGGSNDVAAMYQPSDEARNVASVWEQTVASRSSRVTAAGMRFLQVFVPEKTSVMPHLSPYPVSGPSGMWTALESTIGSSPNVLMWLPTHATVDVPEAVFLQQDSHLSTYGALLLTRAIVQRLGFDASPIEASRVSVHQRTGDLAGRFAALNEHELERAAAAQSVRYAGHELPAPNLIDSFTPESGHTGTRRVWRSPAAPFDQKLVVFGNSFFERGGASFSLSWWFARLFRELHFVWTGPLDLDYAVQAKADVVIGQTIERFLRHARVE